MTDGLAFHFGPILNMSSLDQLPSALPGFSALFHPSEGLTLRWGGQLVATGPSPGSNGWIPVRVKSNGTHADVWLNGVHTVNGAVLSSVASSRSDSPAELEQNGVLSSNRYRCFSLRPGCHAFFLSLFGGRGELPWLGQLTS